MFNSINTEKINGTVFLLRLVGFHRILDKQRGWISIRLLFLPFIRSLKNNLKNEEQSHQY